MHRSNNVCVFCRTSSRIGGYCPRCQNQYYSIGHRRRVPKKTDDKRWKEFIDELIARGVIEVRK